MRLTHPARGSGADGRGIGDDWTRVKRILSLPRGWERVPFETEVGHAVTLEDGKIRRLEVYFDPADALKAVGLAE